MAFGEAARHEAGGTRISLSVGVWRLGRDDSSGNETGPDADTDTGVMMPDASDAPMEAGEYGLPSGTFPVHAVDGLLTKHAGAS
jgi:hypothetical protein